MRKNNIPLQLKNLTVTLTILFLSSTSMQHGHNCIHDKLKDPNFKEIELQPGKSYLPEGAKAIVQKRVIRIKIDYSQSDAFVVQNPDLKAVYDLSKTLLEDVKDYFTAMLNVQTADTLSNPNSFVCGGITVNSFTDEPYDLFIKINAENNA